MSEPATNTTTNPPIDPKDKMYTRFGLIIFILGAIAFALFAFVTIGAFSGCSTPPETITRTEYIDVPVYVHDTITAYMLPDSSWWGVDTVISIQFKDRTFRYWIHDTVKITYTDSIQVVRPPVKLTFWERVQLFSFKIVLGMMLILVAIVLLPKIKLPWQT